MRFTVTCRQEAEDELAEMWASHPDRAAIAFASNEIERQLADDAHLKGTEFYGDRLYVVSPLAAVYRVSVDDCVAEILQLWHQ